MKHQIDIQPDVCVVIVGPSESRIVGVRPEHKRDLHEPRALGQNQADAHVDRPEAVGIVDLATTDRKCQRDQHGP